MSTTEGGSNIVQNGLVFCFDPANLKSFISGSTTANDLKNGTTLTFKNKQYFGGTGDILTTIVPTYDINNKGIIYFNGASSLSGDAVYLPNSDTSTNLTNFVTMSVWFKKTSYNYSWVECPAAKGTNPGPQSFIFYLQNNLVNALLSTTTGSVLLNTVYNINVWNNIVLTYDGATFKLFLDGILKSSIPKTGSIVSSSNPFNIGCQYNGGYFPPSAPSKTSEYFKGYISNVLIYNIGLSDTEVLQNYNALKSRFN